MSPTHADPRAGLDDVPWSRLYHAYGPATDVPAQLRALRSADASERSAAYGRLGGNVYHQGTRWPASHAVVPFLVALAADPATPDRADVVRLLTAVAIGDRRDDELPFDSDRAFDRDGASDSDRAFDRGPVDSARLDGLVGRLYGQDDSDDSDDFDDDEIALLDAAAVHWAAQSYDAAARQAGTIATWLADPDDEIAALAAAVVAWFPPGPAIVAALLAVPGARAAPRASANLALAHSPSTDPRIGPLLRSLLESPHEVVVVTAAVALAYRDADLTVLADVADRDTLPAVPGWGRALRGFVMLALQRLGLG